MTGYLLKVWKTYVDKGFYSTGKKVFKNSLLRLQRNLTYHKKNAKKWEKLGERYKRKRVFVIGNGPSLNKTPLHLLKNEYTVCFNRINILFERLVWRPSFYFCIDETVLKDNVDEITNEILPFVNYAFFPEQFRNKLENNSSPENIDKLLWLYYDFSEFSFKPPNISRSPTVATAALQILPYLGFSEIYLVGVDMNYKLHSTAVDLGKNEIQSKDNDDPNHFDSRYFGTGKKYHQPTAEVIKNIFQSLERVKKHISSTETKIYNATYGGNVEIFERVEFENLFTMTEEDEFKLFNACFSKFISFQSYDDMKRTLPMIRSIGDISSDKEKIFLMEQKEFLLDTSNIVEQFIPFGPFKSIYLLVKRG